MSSAPKMRWKWKAANVPIWMYLALAYYLTNVYAPCAAWSQATRQSMFDDGLRGGGTEDASKPKRPVTVNPAERPTSSSTPPVDQKDGGPAASQRVLPPAAVEAQRRYVATVAAAAATYRSAGEAARRRYINELEAALKDSMLRLDLEGANAIAELKRQEGEQPRRIRRAGPDALDGARTISVTRTDTPEGVALNGSGLIESRLEYRVPVEITATVKTTGDLRLHYARGHIIFN